MSDGEYSLGESNAICRYIAAKYAPELYGPDPETKGTIDCAHSCFFSCTASLPLLCRHRAPPPQH